MGIEPIRIYPEAPWENGYSARFNGTLRREVLNAEWFTTTEQAQIVINHWLKQYTTKPDQIRRSTGVHPFQKPYWRKPKSVAQKHGARHRGGQAQGITISIVY